MAENALTDLFKNIADAIRKAKYTSEPIVANDFPREINDIDIHDICSIWESKEVVISRGAIPNNAFFSNSQISKFTICDGVTRIGSAAFQNSPVVTDITIPDSVTYIGANAFFYCVKLTSIIIPDSVLYMGAYAFGNCSKLTSATIGTGIEKINSQTFYNCPLLAKVIIKKADAVVTLLSKNVFDKSLIATGTDDGYIYVPSNLVDSYKSATNWVTYADKIKAIGSE